MRAGPSEPISPPTLRLCVVAGMPRTGTTSIFHILGDHPQICLPFRKEMGYFLFNWHRGEAWYRRAYRDAAAGQVALDATPEYFFSRAALDRMAGFDADVSVILGVRDPAEVAVSLFHEYGQRFRMPAFDEFLDGYRYRRGSTDIEVMLRPGAIRAQLDAYRERLGTRLLLYHFPLLASDPLALMRAIERFLDLNSWFSASTLSRRHLNRGSRWNARWLSALASRESLIHAAERVVSPGWLRRGARMFYGLPSRSAHRSARRHSSVSAAVHALSDRFRDDSQYISELFAGGSVVDGMGRVHHSTHATAT